MAMDKATQEAIRIGQKQAKAVVALRAEAQPRRERALRDHQKRLGIKPSKAKVGAVTLAAGPLFAAEVLSAGTLVAEGDSWFDYPLHDVLKILEDNYAYDVESVAHKGDPIEEMAYGGGQLEDFTRRIEKLLRGGTCPKAILLSGGGNDVAGDAFAMLLNHACSSISGLNEQVVAGVIGQRISTAYITILSAVTQVCVDKTGNKIPVLVHGYDYPVPDGRGFLGGWWFLPGPWLEPGFRQKGYEDMARRVALAKDLIDRFNTMLGNLVALESFKHVHYIDLRNTLSNGADYKKWWSNELHPSEKGFEAVTKRFATVLEKLP